MGTQQLQLPLASSSSSTCSTILSSILSHHYNCRSTTTSLLFNRSTTTNTILSLSLNHVNHRRSIQHGRVGMDDSGIPATTTAFEDEEDDVEPEPTPEDLEYISQIKKVLELLRKNRDMLFGEVKLTIMIEDPREVERRRLIGIDDSDGPTREDLVAALEEVNDGKIPRDRVALRMLAEEMTSWPNLEAEPSKKTTKNKSLYAKATDTGIDPVVAAKRLNMDWDSAAEIETAENSDDTDVPPVVGYGALYLVSAFPVIIGISVVLILFYNSLQ
ncbi:ycf3-interacting protein 1, chloroplastic-like isoform X1 [Chenopodium quinoa]|uniref:ycf3-interacting protein 1, chloroplastic-like isoform X1 n=1 Tax=Chenopodium quinoa TaxID=63459 RepID=UPI000B7789C2|nr:ycf3-interacting protein 1, chloroplastic-like isoform X1 [Chenopodium quinoa]